MDNYNVKVKEYQDKIEALKQSLSRYKTEYLDMFYIDKKLTMTPETVVNQWLSRIWSMCQAGGYGHRINIKRFDYDLQPSDMVLTAIKQVHYIGCECHLWPSHWNIKPEYFHLIFHENQTIKDAFLALGYNIEVSAHPQLHEWSD
jgi:hypothetical protein